MYRRCSRRGQFGLPLLQYKACLPCGICSFILFLNEFTEGSSYGHRTVSRFDSTQDDPPRTQLFCQRTGARLVACVGADHLYGAVVRGGEIMKWASNSPRASGRRVFLPVGMDCKHIVAAMLEIADRFRRAKADRKSRRENAVAAAAKLHWQKMKANSVPQPPRSPLCQKLTESLGQELCRDEASSVLPSAKQLQQRALPPFDRVGPGRDGHTPRLVVRDITLAGNCPLARISARRLLFLALCRVGTTPSRPPLAGLHGRHHDSHFD